MAARRESPNGGGSQFNSFADFAPSEWDPIFLTRREDVKYAEENEHLIDELDMEEDGLVRTFMKSYDESDSCLPRADKVAEWCFGASLEMLEKDKGGGQRVVALLDESCEAGKAREYQGPLTARDLYRLLLKPRYHIADSKEKESPKIPDEKDITDVHSYSVSDSDSDSEEGHEQANGEQEKHGAAVEQAIEPDAEQTKIFITDLDRWTILALMATASKSQAWGLRDAIYMHLKFENFIGVTFPDSYLTMFQLAFHIPFYAWRTTETPREDHRLDPNSRRLRKMKDVSFLNWSSSRSSDFLYEAQYSCLVAGTDETHWVAYGFFDTYFDDVAKESAEGYHKDSLDELGMLADGLTFGVLEAKHTRRTARKYWLDVFRFRIAHVQREWERVVTKVEESIREYQETHTHSSRLYRNRSSSKSNKEFDEAVRKARDWVVGVKSLTKHLSQHLSRTVDACDGFRSTYARYFRNLSGDRSLPAIQQSFDRLNSLRKNLDDLVGTCAEFTQQLELQVILENGRLSDLQHEIAEDTKKMTLVVLATIPIALATSFLSMNAEFITWVPTKLGSFAFIGLVFIFGFLGLFIIGILQYQTWCWQSVLVLAGQESWRVLRKQGDGTND